MLLTCWTHHERMQVTMTMRGSLSFPAGAFIERMRHALLHLVLLVTAAGARVVAVPFRWQQRDYTCGPASLAMCFAQQGTYFPERALVRACATTAAHGTSHRAMIDAARRAGFHCYVRVHACVRELAPLLRRKLPVIVNYIEPSEETGHYAIITGMTWRTVSLHDPWNGRDFRMSLREFRRRWIDGERRAPHWFMTVSRAHLAGVGPGREYHPC